MFLLALIFCLTSSALGQSLGLGRCPNVDTLASFDINEYEGMWYENRRSMPNIHEMNTKCTNANISQIDNDMMKIVIQFTSSLTGDQFPLTGSGIVDTNNCPNATKCGKLLFQFPLGIAGHDRRPYWILDTDYTSYSVVWSCTNNFLTHTRFLWILTREAEPDNSVIEQATNVLLKNQIDNIPLKATEQKNCP